MGSDVGAKYDRSRLPRWGGLVLLFVAYVATVGGTVLFVEHWIDPTLRTSEIVVPWLAEGVAVAGLMLGGTRLWPALFAGSWLVWGGLVQHPALTVAIDAAAEAGSVVLIVRLLQAWGFARDFDRFRDPLVLLAAATVGRLLAVTIDDLGLTLAVWWLPGTLPPSYLALVTDAYGAAPRLTPQLLGASLRWALNSIAGVVLVVPVAVATSTELREVLKRRPLALAVWALALLAWCAAALIDPFPAARLPLLIGALALVTWAAIRFGVRAATFATLILSMVAAAAFGIVRDSRPAGLETNSLEALWGFVVLLAVTGLLLTVLLAERRRELERLTSRVQRNLRLFRKNPSAVWVAEPGSGRILMVNDQALSRYGYSEAEFTALTVDQLAAGPARATQSAPEAGAELARALKHRTKSGRLIDVDLQSTPIELDGRAAMLCYAVDMTDRYALRMQLLAAADVERRRLAQELHDGLGQVLTGLNLGAQGAALRAARGGAVEAGTVDFLVKSSDHAVSLCEELTRGVSPLESTHGDLVEALRRLPDSLPPATRERVEVRVQADAPLTLSRARAEHLYRIVQEAVGNVIKHAEATRIRIGVGVTSASVSLAVEDDGVGIRPNVAPSAGLGMRSMTLRTTAVGGTLEVSARPGGGTVVRCTCPQLEPPTQEPGVEPLSEAAFAPPGAHAGAAPPAPPWTRTLGYLGQCLLLALACVAGLFVSNLLATLVDPGVVIAGPRHAAPSLFTGIAVAMLIVHGARLWPGVALGGLLGASLILHHPLPFSIYYGAVMSLAAVVGCRLLAHWHFDRAFDRWHDPLLLLGAAVVAAAVRNGLTLTAGLGIPWLQPGGVGPAVSLLAAGAGGASAGLTPAFLAAEARWWANGVAGIVLVVPMLVAIPPLFQSLRERRGEAVIWCVAVVCWVVALFALNDAGARWLLVAVALMLLLWAVVRFGVAGASAATFACAMAATVGFALQHGVLKTVDVNEGISTLWGFVALLTITGLFLTSLLAERNLIRDKLARSAERYRRLFEFDPHPLWVQDQDTGRVLMVNAQAVRHYGYSRPEWLALPADRLSAEGTGPVRAAPTRDGQPIETRHRLRNGAVIDVELSYAPLEADGHPALLCYAVDVTERNALRRGFLEATDLERRRLAEQLEHGLGRALAELEQAATRFREVAATGRHDPAAIELVATASHRAALACRQVAHGASPLQANNGDLLEALLALPEQLATPAATRIDVQVQGDAPISLPLAQCEHLYGLVRSAVADAADNAGAREIVVRLEIEPALLRVAIEDDGRSDRDQPHGRLPALHVMSLRATSMGARLWHSPRPYGGRTIVCECPQSAAAA